MAVVGLDGIFMPRKGQTIAPDTRFWNRVNKDGPLWNGTPCWLWTGYLACRYGNLVGYGKFHVRYEGSRQIMIPAHQWSYEQVKGLVPHGLEIDHLCRVLNCVNPDHLEAVTHYENQMRGASPVAMNAQKTHCKQGHEFNEQNTYKRPNGRECRACKSQWW